MVSPDHGPDGLQIKPVQGGEVGGKAGGEAEGWQDVTLPPLGRDTPVMIVNTGALMARWTNDEWNATAHRVIVTDEVAAARSRYSVACFIDPDNESLVQSHTNFGEPKYEPITSNDYLKEKLESMMKKG
jgi:isopenicillin N synthase-like dioxygenase